MRKQWYAYILIMPVAFISGCGDDVRSEPEARFPVEVAPTSSVPDEVAMAVAEIERDFESIPNVITNHWSQARDVAHRIGAKIVNLPHGLSEQYGRRMADEILSFPIVHLPYYDRSHSLDVMWDMVSEVGWRGIKPEDVWELHILCLKRLRVEIEYVQKEEKGRGNRSYLTSVSNNLNGAILTWEVQLAYRDSKSNPPPRTLECQVVSDEEYAAIRKRFEEFLGRPIRSYEEIMRIDAERSEQAKRAMERRPPDSDVKVDVGDL